MAVVRVNPNLGAEVTGHLAERGPMSAVLGHQAELIAWRAKMIARAEFYRTGGYLRGIQAEHGTDEHGNLVGRVVATKYTSHWAEFGWGTRTGGTHARHVLARAAQQVGYTVLAGHAGGVANILAGAAARRVLSGGGRMAISGSRGAITGR